MRIGVDVGGTNTDAVALRGGEVVSWIKQPTSADISTGIVDAISVLLEREPELRDALECIVIGTTQFTNAFIERDHLEHVGVLRLALPSTSSLLPRVGWPDDLIAAVGDEHMLLPGGYECDGTEQESFNEEETDKAIEAMLADGVRNFAISSVYAPINSKMERQAAHLIRDRLPEANITLSSQIGRIGLLERENAAIMNAALAEYSKSVVASFRSALKTLGLDAPFYISQNDGTLMSAEKVEKFPILTFASGPTNSMRGAAFLAGIDDAIVVDIGGTTTDVGVLASGYPRESSRSVDIGGVRTNFRMPDILAIGIGGGSLVHGDGKGEVSVGPKSVGREITSKARVFGGSTLTATDIAVASSDLEIGDPSQVADLPEDLVSKASETIGSAIENAIDRMKTSSSDVPVILVGGGSILVNGPLKGVSKIVRSELSAVANAIGAGMAQVGGEVDKVYFYEKEGRELSIEKAKEAAIDDAIKNGAQPSSVEVIELDEVPLAYMSGGAARIRVKAIGDLSDGDIK